MSQSLTLTVLDIQPTQVIATTPAGERWTIPLSAMLGKPVLNQSLFVMVAALGNETGAEHPLAKTIIEHLLASSS